VKRGPSVFFGLVLIVAAVWVTQAGPASAATCTGGEITGTGSVVVPSGATCTLSGVAINGNITVQPSATLNLVNSVVQGTLTAQNAEDVNVSGSFLRGMSITGARAGDDNVFSLCGNTVAGPVTISSVPSPAGVTFGAPASCAVNTVCGPFSARYNSAALTINGNTVTGAGTVVYNSNLQAFQGNTFGGLVTATGNSPTNGGLNTPNSAEARSVTCSEPSGSSSSPTFL